MVFPPPAGLLVPRDAFSSAGLVLDVPWLALVFPGAQEDALAPLPWGKNTEILLLTTSVQFIKGSLYSKLNPQTKLTAAITSVTC